MFLQELFNSNIKSNLVNEIETINLSNCSNHELVVLRKWANEVRNQADLLTLEDEIVGYTYHNLDAITPMMTCEESKRDLPKLKMKK